MHVLKSGRTWRVRSPSQLLMNSFLILRMACAQEGSSHGQPLPGKTTGTRFPACLTAPAKAEQSLQR